ncbi:MAG: ABC transporter ATP-binding protein [Candidatus Omnitrophota bacterium]
MTFFRYLREIWNERKKDFSLIVFVMSAVAFVEAVKIMLIVPLLNYIFNQEMQMIDSSIGFLGLAIGFLKNVSSFLGLPFSLGFVLFFIIGVFCLGGALKIIQMHLQYKLRLEYMFFLSHKLFKSYLSSRWSFFVNNKPGKLVNILAVVIPQAGVAFHHLCITIASFIVILMYVSLAVFVSWKLTCLILLMLPLFFIFLRRLTNVSEEFGAQNIRMTNKLQAESLENILSAKMIKASATEEQSLNCIDNLVKESHHYYYYTMMSSALMASLQEPMGIIILSLAIYVSLTFMNISSPAVILILIIFFRLAPRFYELQRNYQQSLIFIPAYYEVKKTISNNSEIKEKSGNLTIDDIKEEIAFENVNFSHDKENPVLKGINIRIAKGETIGIIGPSGSGKSTIADLLVGLIKPDSGKILVDGVILNAYDHNSWRKSVGYVTQEMNLFNDTVRTNLTWMRQDASEDEMVEAAKLGNAHDFITRLPNGYDTIIGDRGYRLSGGQRQRIALSRVILSNPKIYIFDEATSALDSESEVKIQQSIDSLAASKTSLVIAHRISTLKNTSRIYVLDKGEIVACGTWNDLISKSEIFKDLVTMQSL